MKTLKFIAVIAVLTLILSTCTTGNATLINGKPTLAAVSDVAAKVTLALQTSLATSTPTLAPSPSPTSTVISAVAENVMFPVDTAIPLNYCDNSIFVSDATIPDGTVLAPGEAFTKTWTFQNNGSCLWNTSYLIARVNGIAMNGNNTYLPETTAVGELVDVSVSMVAPDTAGTYTSYWRLQNETGILFGETVDVQIVVSDDAATITPTPTDTVSPSSTPTPTDTASPTDTPTPTNTASPSNTPTPTNTVAPTSTPTPTDTVAPSSTPTPTGTASPSNTPTPTDTVAPSSTPTPTNTVSPSSTPVPTNTVSPSREPKS